MRSEKSDIATSFVLRGPRRADRRRRPRKPHQSDDLRARRWDRPGFARDRDLVAFDHPERRPLQNEKTAIEPRNSDQREHDCRWPALLVLNARAALINPEARA